MWESRARQNRIVFLINIFYKNVIGQKRFPLFWISHTGKDFNLTVKFDFRERYNWRNFKFVVVQCMRSLKKIELTYLFNINIRGCSPFLRDISRRFQHEFQIPTNRWRTSAGELRVEYFSEGCKNLFSSSLKHYRRRQVCLLESPPEKPPKNRGWQS